MGHRGGPLKRVTIGVVVVISALLILSGCGAYAPDAPTSPITNGEVIGTWTSKDAGTVTFGADGSAELLGVPYRGIVDDPDARATPTDRSGTWSFEDDPSTHDWHNICIDMARYGSCVWTIRGLRGHRELDLIVGDPDSVDWYRYHRIDTDGRTTQSAASEFDRSVSE